MKDALGHGSDAHSAGVQFVGKSPFGDSARHEWAMKQVADAESRRNWAQLPSDFQADAVKTVFGRLKGFMDKNLVGHRIAASRARTFHDLRTALETGRQPDKA